MESAILKRIVNENVYRTCSRRVLAYTAAASVGISTLGVQTGIGVWFGRRHRKNVSKHFEIIDAEEHLAEYEAARKAIEIALREGIEKLTIFTSGKCVQEFVALCDEELDINCSTNVHRVTDRCRSSTQRLYYTTGLCDVEIVCTPGRRDFGTRMAKKLALKGACKPGRVFL